MRAASAAATAAKAPPRVSVMSLAPAWRRGLPRAATLARRAARAALDGAGNGRALEICLVLADDACVRRLNRAYRGIDKPTNVLAFGGYDAAPGDAAAPGDVVLAHETVVGEARAGGIALADHVRHLVVHGVLHLLGHDHERAAEARRMRRAEIAVLAGLGVGDPYRRGRRR
jgi:probable rRNA maturation factor